MKPLIASILLWSVSAAAAPASFWIDLYATTDLHGHAEASPATLNLDGHKVEVERGGLARLGGYLKNARRHNPGNVLLVDGGDMLQGTLVSNIGEGQAMVRAMNLLGYTAAALGNHEFDFGPVGPNPIPRAPGDDPLGVIKARARESHFAWLTANIHDAAGKPPGAPTVRRYVLATAGGISIGIVGGTSEDTPRTTAKANLRGLTFESLSDSLAKAADEARAAGAKLVIAVVHAGGDCPHTGRLTEAAPGDTEGCEQESEVFILARKLAEAKRVGRTGGIDAIIGGHTHQPLTAVVAGIPIAQAYKHGLELGRVSFEVDGVTKRPTGRFVVDRPIEICSQVTKDGSCDPARAKTGPLSPPDFYGPIVLDAAIEASLTEDLARVAELRAKPVGIRLSRELRGDYRTESPLGNLVADAIRAATSTDIGMTNGGGLRTSLPAGELLYGSLFEALPFENHLATLTLSGKQLFRLLRANLIGTKGALLFSGAHLAAHCEGQQLVLSASLDDGRPITDNGRYHIGTTDFLAQGGDDVVALGEDKPTAQVDDTGPYLRDVVAVQLGKRGGTLDVADPKLFDPAHPRLSLPGRRPLHCP